MLWRWVVSLSILLLLGSSARGQRIISAHAGLILAAEGEVLLDGAALPSRPGRLSAMHENSTLQTANGRAEVLLTPGVFLRLGENSSIRLISNQLYDARVEFTSGSAVLEAVDLQPDNAVTLLYPGSQLPVSKAGYFRIDSSAAGTTEVVDRSAQQAAYQPDALDRWSALRTKVDQATAPSPIKRKLRALLWQTRQAPSRTF